MLTPKQEEHLNRILDAFNELTVPKYTKGAIEHGGNLSEVPELAILDMAIEEAIDQFVYLWTLREKIAKRADNQ